ncbi:hypothetical protein HC031_20220 [Planosporangium thailandense]|uniref:ESX-1 secretion-associated protein n=1 Tax=Planosporangium thailandense TaxID=765197 RepID=A0ABX0Y3Q5_9ACTN|nr:hypothetical protein [Planosporangium thailandense]NJC72024.1 hypothetical protein [Planosporangium thailandense]
MPENVIQVDPSALRSLAGRLQNLAATFKDPIYDLNHKPNDLQLHGPVPIGAGASLQSSISRNCQQTANHLQNAMAGLERLADDLRAFADKYHDANELAKTSALNVWTAFGPDLQQYFATVSAVNPAGASAPNPAAGG